MQYIQGLQEQDTSGYRYIYILYIYSIVCLVDEIDTAILYKGMLCKD